LCFDELQATDVTDASLITRIFEGLLAYGVIIVATSNRCPSELYQGEVQKDRFEQLTQLIHSHFDVIHLQSPYDYRKRQAEALQTTYFAPLGKAADAFIKYVLAHLSPSHHQEITPIMV